MEDKVYNYNRRRFKKYETITFNNKERVTISEKLRKLRYFLKSTVQKHDKNRSETEERLQVL